MAVKVPATVKPLLTVVVPDDAPSETVVAAEPIFKVVALVLKTLAVDLRAIRFDWVAPSIAKPAEAVAIPVSWVVPSMVKLPLAWMLPVLESVEPVEP